VPPPVEAPAPVDDRREEPEAPAPQTQPSVVHDVEHDDEELDELRATLARLTERLESDESRFEEVVRERAREAAEALLAEREAVLEEAAVALEVRLHALEAFVADVRSGDPAAADLAAELEELRTALQALPGREEVAAAGAADELAERMGELETRLSQLDEHSQTLEEIAVNRARGAAEELVAEHDRSLEEAAALKERVAELERAVAERDVAARVEELAGQVHALAEQVGAPADEVDTVDLDEALAALAGRLEDRIAELEQRPAPGPAEDPRVERLDAELDEVRQNVAELVERLQNDAAASDVEALTAELAELRQAQAQLAERESSAPEPVAIEDAVAPVVAALSSRIDELAHRLSEAVGVEERFGEELNVRLDETARTIEDRLVSRIPDPSGIAAEVAALTARLVELEQSTANGDVGERIDALDRRVSRLDELEQRLAGEVRSEIEARIGELEQGPADDERIAELEQKLAAVAEIGERLEALEQGANRDPRVDELEQRFESVAGVGERLAALEERAAADERVGEIEERLTSLGETADRMAAELRAELEARVTATSGGVDERVSELEARLSSLAEVEQRIGAKLRKQLDELRVDRAQVVAESAALATRLAQLEELSVASNVTERLAELEQRLASFDGVEERIEAELRSRLEPRLAELDRLASGRDDRVDDLERRLSAVDGVEDRLRTELHDRVGATEAAATELAGGLSARLDEVDRRQQATETGVEALEARLREEIAAELRAEVEALTARVGTSETALTEAAKDLDERLAELDALYQAAQAALGERLSETEASIWETTHELEGRLLDLRRDQEAAHRSLEVSIEPRLGGLESRVRALDESEEQVRAELRALLDRRTEKLETKLASASEAFMSRLDELGSTLGTRLDAAEGNLGAVEERIGSDVRSALERLHARLEERADALHADQEQARLDAQSGIKALFAQLADRQQVVEREVDATLGSLASSLEERMNEVEGKIPRLGDAEERIRAELRGALERQSGRIGKRLVENEELVGAVAERLVERLEAVETRLDEVDVPNEQIGELAAAVDALSERVQGQVATALAALAGFPAQQAPADVAVHVEPTAEPQAVEDDPEPETTLPPAAETPNVTPAACFLAFVPTASAYKLVELEGNPPAVGAELELEGATERLVVARVVQSPLPLDRRPCVYLEAAPSFGHVEP